MFNLKSIGKAFREVGIAAGSVAAVAAVTFLQDPGAFDAVLEAFGPFALLAAPALQFGLKYLQDAVKHLPS